MPHVTGLFIYPVKSLRGCAVPAVTVDALGFAGDRRFLVVGADGVMLTQRGVPRMAQVEAALANGTLTLSADRAGGVSVPTAPDPAAAPRTVAVWKSEGLQVEDCGEDAAAWLTAFLGIPCRLVRTGQKFRRSVTKPAAHPGDVVGFADAAPVLIAGEASLAVLNDRILENQGEPVPMDRFRPNLVVAGCPAFAEDTWPAIRVGAVVLRNAGKSDRCIMTTTDQRTGARGKEPLRTLATFRRDPPDATAVYFGVNYINESKLGTLKVGDPVSVA